MITDYLLIRLIFIIVLIAPIYFYKKDKLPKFIMILSSSFSLLILIYLFFITPSLNSNLKTYNKLNKIEIEKLMSIDIDKEPIHYNITSKSEIKEIINCFKNLQEYSDEHPRPLYQYNLVLNFKNNEKIRLRSVKVENKTSMMILLNKKGNKYYEIATYSNDKLLLYIENFIKKRK